MTNRSNDDIANALRGLASGEHSDADRQVQDVGPQPLPGPRPPAAPVNSPRPPPTPRPGAPARPAAPVNPGVKIPPPAGITAALPPTTAFVSDVPPAGVDDDDAVIMPAPSVEYLAHQPHHAPVPTRSPAERTVRFRATVIPIMLTGGLLMVAAAVLKYTVAPDAPLAAMPTWSAFLLLLTGAALLVVAGLNVAQARK